VATVVYAMRLALALAAAAVAASLASELTSGLWEHDLALFEPGALYASEALRLWQRPVGAGLRGAVWVGLAVAYLGLLPLAGAIAALAHPRWRMRAPALVRAATGAFAPLSLLLGSTLVLQALVGGFFAAIAIGVRGALSPHTSDRTADLFAVAIAVVGWGAVCALGVAQDLARIRVVRDRATFLDAARGALLRFAGSPLAIFGSWGARAAAGITLLVLTAWLAGTIGVASRGALATVTLLHQIAAFLLVLLRISWLSAALGHQPRTT
jgi:hypothetical protein